MSLKQRIERVFTTLLTAGLEDDYERIFALLLKDPNQDTHIEKGLYFRLQYRYEHYQKPSAYRFAPRKSKKAHDESLRKIKFILDVHQPRQYDPTRTYKASIESTADLHRLRELKLERNAGKYYGK